MFENDSEAFFSDTYDGRLKQDRIVTNLEDGSWEPTGEWSEDSSNSKPDSIKTVSGFAGWSTNSDETDESSDSSEHVFTNSGEDAKTTGFQGWGDDSTSSSEDDEKQSAQSSGFKGWGSTSTTSSTSSSSESDQCTSVAWEDDGSSSVESDTQDKISDIKKIASGFSGWELDGESSSSSDDETEERGSPVSFKRTQSRSSTQAREHFLGKNKKKHVSLGADSFANLSPLIEGAIEPLTSSQKKRKKRSSIFKSSKSKRRSKKKRRSEGQL